MARKQTGALGGRFYYFPDGQPVRIIYTKLPGHELLRRPPTTETLLHAAHEVRRLVGEFAELNEAVTELEHYDRLHEALTILRRRAEEVHQSGGGDEILASLEVLDAGVVTFESVGVQYANPWHPNAIQTLHNGDADAVLELLGHVRAENPGSDVRWVASDEVQNDDLTGHVILLGQGDQMPGRGSGVLRYLRERLDMPVEAELPIGGDPEYDSRFVVTLDKEGRPDPDGAEREIHVPRFVLDEKGRPVLDDGQPRLEYDVAMLGRFENPLNLSATVTICSGIFSRGTYGAVRALTDAILRARNERYLLDHFDLAGFWLLLHVPVFAGATGALTVTPDLSRPFHRLRGSA